MSSTLLTGVHRLRTRDDAVAALRGSGGRVVVVGDGLLASEAASDAQALGWTVTLLVEGSAPLRSDLGPYADAVATLHRRNGVHVLTDARVTGIHRSGDSLTVTLADGWQCPADTVLLADDPAAATWCEGRTGVPTLTTELHGRRLEAAGRHAPDDIHEVAVGSVAAGSFVAIHRRRGHAVAVVALDQPGHYSSLQRRLTPEPGP